MPLTTLFSLTLAFAGSPDPACTGPLTRRDVMRCAAAASPRILADRERVAAARGDTEAARVLLPANPTASVTVAHRWNPDGQRALNVNGTLTQRIEIAGQRGKRRDEAAAVLSSAEHQARATERHVVAAALLAYYDLLAARARLEIVERGQVTAKRLHDAASERASVGVGSPLDGELAKSEATGLVEQVALARGDVKVAEARLAVALGLDPARQSVEARGLLEPLDTPAALASAADGAHARPELEARKADVTANRASVERLRRARIPSPSLSVFVQSDGFNERVVGGGIAFPIPLPFPLGQTNRGEIESARARVREADARVEAERRALTLEATIAWHDYEARRGAAAAYRVDDLVSAERTLGELSAEIERGRLPVSEALTHQRALLDLLVRAVEAQHALCRASVALALASDLPLDGGVR